MTPSIPGSAHAALFPGYRERARLSEGQSVEAVHRMVASAMAARGLSPVVLADVGCGRGDFHAVVGPRCSRYIGVDAVRYDGFPSDAEFVSADLNEASDFALPGGPADVVASLETIEHLENPRAFMRLLFRLTRPGGWVFVTTPNQRSALSLATLVTKGHFSHFQDVHYPAHLTALLDVDLQRMAGEIGLERVAIEYTGAGRIVFSAHHYPAWLSRAFPRGLSDNLLLAGQRPR
jgi:2-polyprenyl-3-methyl-5-hydroxy-6-metoxy-1,4-benzoquinol methylase